MWRGQGHTSGGQSVRERSGPSDLCCFPVGRHQRRRAGCRRPAKTPAVPSASARDAYHSASPAAATPAPQLRARSLSPQTCGRGHGPSGGRPAPAAAVRAQRPRLPRPPGWPLVSPPDPGRLCLPFALRCGRRGDAGSAGRSAPPRPRLSLPPRGAILTGAAAPRVAVLARAPCQRSVAQRAVMSLHAVQSGRVCAAGLAVFPVFRILRPWPRVGSSLSPAYCFLCQTKS